MAKSFLDLDGVSHLISKIKTMLTTTTVTFTAGGSYNAAIDTEWGNKLSKNNKNINGNLAIRLKVLSANTDYGVFLIPSGYQPTTEFSKVYLTHLGTKVLVTFRTSNVLVIRPLSAITTTTEILYINESWIQA